MTSLYICDGSDVAPAAGICRSSGWGIEVQAFYDPAVAEEREVVEQHKSAVAGLSRVSLHGPFGDLCAGISSGMCISTTTVARKTSTWRWGRDRSRCRMCATVFGNSRPRLSGPWSASPRAGPSPFSGLESTGISTDALQARPKVQRQRVVDRHASAMS